MPPATIYIKLYKYVSIILGCGFSQNQSTHQVDWSKRVSGGQRQDLVRRGSGLGSNLDSVFDKSNHGQQSQIRVRSAVVNSVNYSQPVSRGSGAVRWARFWFSTSWSVNGQTWSTEVKTQSTRDAEYYRCTLANSFPWNDTWGSL
ncbi:hypothetical protein HanXRQr2_Chr02g0068201 [Helianthus annuus]|uniref:Uncharacterized protein n=1 Tax=Helianthus annuus TaxID=4232 RepID=A0A9K3JP05_HELAN|nr:hypothetical protein HanXRQr2_Chr02g0068201 [Helianthus annuus]KAJ0604878.1 hypothetical protein HanHA300_Chr02g0056661 [Helianthus annuus]KAJ0618897.1 hypothetical protein HanHA89_Chr02g0065201 [Helianthus annuus]KAJ0777353.1 hypothetical protein HanLR1_Chr02g0059491 [Helianthus annuus]